METAQIISFLQQNPGAIAQEIGATPVEMTRLAETGLVTKVGIRKTGKRGRPPVEWAVTDAVKSGAVEAKSLINTPSLPSADHVRAIFDDSEQRMVDYIEDNFRGVYGQREQGDYTILRERYREIVRAAERRARRSALVQVEEAVAA